MKTVCLNYQNTGRELLTLDEVRKLDKAYALLFISGELPVLDRKFDLMKHPNIKYTEYGGAAPYVHKKEQPPIPVQEDLSFTFTKLDNVELIEMEALDNEQEQEKADEN